MAFLELRDLRYSYGKTEVLHGVSCLFELGGVYAVIGKSGSGKTTLLSLLAGLDAPASGDILFEGESIGKKDLLTYRREKVSVVYQNFRLFPLMTALENVMYPLELRGVKPKEAAQRGAAYMESVGLDAGFHNRFPSMLSGGEQQRVAIARALAMETRLILADEPTGNLDTGNRDNIFRILSQLAHDKGYCVVVVTHDNDLIHFADGVHSIRDGVFAV